MSKVYLVSGGEDELGHFIGVENARHDPLTSDVKTFAHKERQLLSGSYFQMTQFFEEEAPAIEKSVDLYCAAHEEVVVEVGYSFTMLLAAYYAVLHSKNVTVSLQTPPSFGGDTKYARSHPFLIQKLLHHVVYRAKKVLLPSSEAGAAILDVYPRLIDLPNAIVAPLSIPESFLPPYHLVRDGIAIFADFKPGSGLDATIRAIATMIAPRYPGMAKTRIRILGAGDHKQADSIVAGFPDWHVELSPPTRNYRESAAMSEIVILPDDPESAGPSRELLCSLGAGAAIIAHEGSAAGDYAGDGALLFPEDEDRATAIASRLLPLLIDPTKTFALMASTKARRDNLRSKSPALAVAPPLDSLG